MTRLKTKIPRRNPAVPEGTVGRESNVHMHCRDCREDRREHGCGIGNSGEEALGDIGRSDDSDHGPKTGRSPRRENPSPVFDLREGMPIGCKVTLRGVRMYEFLDRLISIALPRVRDFRGLESERHFDGNGNYSIGLTEQLVFPELNPDKFLTAPRA